VVAVPVTKPPRRLPPEARREQILDAAEHVLLEHGLRETTVADVAAAAGVAKGTMYLHVVSKDDLLAALRARYIARLGEATASSDSGDTRARLRTLVQGLFTFSAANWQLHHVLFHEAGFSEADAFGDLRERLTALIADGVEAGEWRVGDVALAGTFVVHGIHGALIHALHGGRHPRPQRVATTVADLVERTLTGAPAA
jgi:TetR/AcrR family fatty acid metabolism transcriptional regulator